VLLFCFSILFVSLGFSFPLFYLLCYYCFLFFFSALERVTLSPFIGPLGSPLPFWSCLVFLSFYLLFWPSELRVYATRETPSFLHYWGVPMPLSSPPLPVYFGTFYCWLRS